MNGEVAGALFPFGSAGGGAVFLVDELGAAIVGVFDALGDGEEVAGEGGDFFLGMVGEGLGDGAGVGGDQDVGGAIDGGFLANALGDGKGLGGGDAAEFGDDVLEVDGGGVDFGGEVAHGEIGEVVRADPVGGLLGRDWDDGAATGHGFDGGAASGEDDVVVGEEAFGVGGGLAEGVAEGVEFEADGFASRAKGFDGGAVWGHGVVEDEGAAGG